LSAEKLTEGVDAMEERQPYNSNGTPETQVSAETPAYESKSVPDKKSILRRPPWNRLAVFLILLGGAMFAASWLGGARGGYVYFAQGRPQVHSENRSDRVPAEFPLGLQGIPINDIRVISSAMNIEVHPTTGPAQMSIYGGITPDITFEKGVLTIDTRVYEQSRSWAFSIGFNGPARAMKLYLPHVNGMDMDINVTSGNVRINNIKNGGELTVNATSGNISITDSYFAAVDLHVRSGNIRLNDGRVHALTATATSGNINIDTTTVTLNHPVTQQLIPSNITLQARSGNIRFHDRNRHNPVHLAYNLQATSGNIAVNGVRNRGNAVSNNTPVGTWQPYLIIDIRATSGNINLIYR
jgi:hypothetical protein